MPEKILIADDDLETLRLVGLMLQRQGYQIVAANNGVQALSQAQIEKPDLIILDVMMPDMDGYQVTRRLRQEGNTANVPILMFTAKSQVDDKVAGYDAGVDDYLTKPVHPAELVAHVKALLSRNKARGTAPVATGHLVGVVAPKGGLGTSTLVLNLGMAMHLKYKVELIAAEMRPCHGSWSMDLGLGNDSALTKLLRMKTGDITPSVIERELVRTADGVRLLMASSQIKDIDTVNAAPQFEAILNGLSTLAPYVLLDFGTIFQPGFDKYINMCQELIVVTEPYPGSISKTQILLEELAEKGFGKSKFATLVLVNRIRADIQLSVTQVQDKLGMKVAQVIPPAPEQAYHAAIRSIPLTQIQPDGLVAQQFSRLAELMVQHIQK